MAQEGRMLTEAQVVAYMNSGSRGAYEGRYPAPRSSQPYS